MTATRLATRSSDLARTQSLQIARALEEQAGVQSELTFIHTEGDQKQDVSLAEAGVIGLFTAEVQNAVLDGRADFAVHSLKDLPAEQTPSLQIAAIPPRADSADWLIIRKESYRPERTPLPLAEGAVVGTSAARREAFLQTLCPDLKPTLLRGNVPTRVKKLADGQYDAILLAAAGLQRLDFDLSGFEVFPLAVDFWPGAPGQGALALECRVDDENLATKLATLHDETTAQAIAAERGLLRALGGGCGLPLGAHCQVSADEFRLTASFGMEGETGLKLARADVQIPKTEDLEGDLAKLIEAARVSLLGVES